MKKYLLVIAVAALISIPVIGQIDPSAQNEINGTFFAQLTSDFSTTGTTLVNSSLAITLTPGTYRITDEVYLTTASTTGGAQAEADCTTSDTVGFNAVTNSVVNGTPVMRQFFGSGSALPIVTALADAPALLAGGSETGLITVAATTTYTVGVKQRTALDASNPVLLKKGSWILAERIR